MLKCSETVLVGDLAIRGGERAARCGVRICVNEGKQVGHSGL